MRAWHNRPEKNVLLGKNWCLKNFRLLGKLNTAFFVVFCNVAASAIVDNAVIPWLFWECSSSDRCVRWVHTGLRWTSPSSPSPRDQVFPTLPACAGHHAVAPLLLRVRVRVWHGVRIPNYLLILKRSVHILSTNCSVAFFPNKSEFFTET